MQELGFFLFHEAVKITPTRWQKKPQRKQKLQRRQNLQKNLKLQREPKNQRSKGIILTEA